MFSCFVTTEKDLIVHGIHEILRPIEHLLLEAGKMDERDFKVSEGSSCCARLERLRSHLDHHHLAIKKRRRGRILYLRRGMFQFSVNLPPPCLTSSSFPRQIQMKLATSVRPPANYESSPPDFWSRYSRQLDRIFSPFINFSLFCCSSVCSCIAF